MSCLQLSYPYPIGESLLYYDGVQKCEGRHRRPSFLFQLQQDSPQSTPLNSTNSAKSMNSMEITRADDSSLEITAVLGFWEPE